MSEQPHLAPVAPVDPMAGGNAARRIAVVAAVIVTAVAILGLWLKSKNRPWNETALVASFSRLRVDTSSDATFSFDYRVENRTDEDYYLPDTPGGLFMLDASSSVLERAAGFRWGRRAFIPSRRAVIVSLIAHYPFDGQYSEGNAADASAVAAFVRTRLATLRGFVLFDKRNRYQINFPAPPSPKAGGA